MWIFRLILTLFIIMVVVGFSIYNSGEKVTVRLLGHTYEQVPMVVVAYWGFAVGIVVAFVLSITYYSRLQHQLADQKKENKKLLSELTSLRNVALEEAEE